MDIDGMDMLQQHTAPDVITCPYHHDSSCWDLLIIIIIFLFFFGGGGGGADRNGSGDVSS